MALGRDHLGSGLLQSWCPRPCNPASAAAGLPPPRYTPVQRANMVKPSRTTGSKMMNAAQASGVLSAIR